MKHTPGPWTQGHTEEGKACVWLDGHVEPDSGMGSVGTWIDCNTEENARLVAAAPELLEALQRLLAQDDNGEDEIWVRNKARAAIAKATGEQP